MHRMPAEEKRLTLEEVESFFNHLASRDSSNYLLTGAKNIQDKCYKIEIAIEEFFYLNNEESIDSAQRIAEKYSSEDWTIQIMRGRLFSLLSLYVIDNQGLKISTLTEAIVSLNQAMKKIKEEILGSDYNKGRPITIRKAKDFLISLLIEEKHFFSVQLWRNESGICHLVEIKQDKPLYFDSKDKKKRIEEIEAVDNITEKYSSECWFISLENIGDGWYIFLSVSNETGIRETMLGKAILAFKKALSEINEEVIDKKFRNC